MVEHIVLRGTRMRKVELHQFVAWMCCTESRETKYETAFLISRRYIEAEGSNIRKISHENAVITAKIEVF